jgi:hypothetical protein
LFALTAAVTAIALMIMTPLATFARAQAIDCVCMGTIIAGAACIRTIERYETRRSSPQRSVRVLLWTFVACSAALAICGAVVILGATREMLIATAYGILALTCISIIRHFALGAIGITAIAVPALGTAILLLAYHPAEHGTSVPFAFAGASNPSRIALSERVLYDAPLVGTGAGTFTALAPIYREIDEPRPESTAATVAATIAIELGKPMVWLITLATGSSIFILLMASLQRGRDSFYSAMGGSWLITLLLPSFNNAGLLGTASSSITATVIRSQLHRARVGQQNIRPARTAHIGAVFSLLPRRRQRALQVSTAFSNWTGHLVALHGRTALCPSVVPRLAYLSWYTAGEAVGAISMVNSSVSRWLNDRGIF